MARDFNGTTDYIDRAAGPVSTATDNITVSCFVNLDAKVSEEIVSNGYSNGVSAGTGYQLRFSNSNQRFQFDIALVAGITGTTNPNTGEWYHLLGQISAGTAYLYVNGASEGTPTAATAFAPSTYFNIGCIKSDTGTAGTFTDGRICEVGLWNRVLSASEISGLASGYAPTFYPSNLMFYSSLFGQNTPEVDKKSSSVLTMNGTTKATHPDFIKYPGSQSKGKILRPRIFAPGMAR